MPEINQEIAINFARLFQNAIGAKKYLLVSVDHYSGWPEAKFLRKPNTEKVIDILKKYITRHGISRTIITDPATTLEAINSRILQRMVHKPHRMPNKNHRGKGEKERLIRTINERLRTNK